MIDNRRIVFQTINPPPRPRLGFFGFIGLVFWVCVIVWVFK